MRVRARHWSWPALLLLPLAACAAHGSTPNTADLPSKEFAGHLTVTEGSFWFQPCGVSDAERWWVTFTGGSIRELQDARTSGRIVPGERSFVRLRAAATDERVAGPGGPALLVREILEMRAAGQNDCARSGGW